MSWESGREEAVAISSVTQSYQTSRACGIEVIILTGKKRRIHFCIKWTCQITNSKTTTYCSLWDPDDVLCRLSRDELSNFDKDPIEDCSVPALFKWLSLHNELAIRHIYRCQEKSKKSNNRLDRWISWLLGLTSSRWSMWNINCLLLYAKVKAMSRAWAVA